MSSSVSTTQTPVSSLPKLFSLCYQMEFKINSIPQIKKQLNRYKKLTHDRFFDFELKFNDESQPFLLLQFLKKVFLFNSTLVKNDKIETEDFIEVNEVISLLKKKIKKAIEKKYFETNVIKDCTVNLSEETNNLLDHLFHPEKVNKIMKTNKVLINLFKTNYIHPKQYDIKDIFIEKKMTPKEIKDKEYIKELEAENTKLKGNRSFHDKMFENIIEELKEKEKNLRCVIDDLRLNKDYNEEVIRQQDKDARTVHSIHQEMISKLHNLIDDKNKEIHQLKEERCDDKLYIKDNEDNFFRLRIKYDELEGKYNALHNDTIDYEYMHVLDKRNKELVQELNHKEEVFNKLVVVSKDLQKKNKDLTEAMNNFMEENYKLKNKSSKKNKNCDCCNKLWSKCVCMCGNCFGDYKICKYECYKK